MRMKCIKTVIVMTLLLSPLSLQASILDELLGPIKRIADGIMSQYGISLDTLTEAKAQLTATKSQLQEISRIKEFNQGSYGWGDLKNTFQDLKERQWSADNWQDTVNDIAGKNSSRYQALLKAYQKAHPLLDSKLFKGQDSSHYQTYKDNKLLAQNADSQATASYNRVNQHFDNIHKLSREIEKAKNSKSAIDLNARLTAENANVQTEILKQLSILNKQSASENQNKLTTIEEAASFNQLPDE